MLCVPDRWVVFWTSNKEKRKIRKGDLKTFVKNADVVEDVGCLVQSHLRLKSSLVDPSQPIHYHVPFFLTVNHIFIFLTRFTFFAFSCVHNGDYGKVFLL